MKMYHYNFHVCFIFLFCCVFPRVTFGRLEEISINGFHNKVVICHVEIWSVYRPDAGKFTVDHIDPSLCTHLIFGYVHLNETTDDLITPETWTELLGSNPADSISKLKLKNPDIKSLVSIGGWLDGSIKYSRMSANLKRVEQFVKNTVKFILHNGLDGIELVWQYPGKRGGTTRDRENYIRLLQNLKDTFEKHNFILAACVGSSKDTIDYGYDIPKLSEVLDYMLVYNYDYHGWWSRMTGANSGLIGPDFLNVEYSITYLLKLGADPNKLLLGVPLFARNYILNDTSSFNESQPQFGQKFIEHGFKGPFTNEDGFLSYQEVCLYLKNTSQNWKVFWDDASETPMAVFDDKMITFENERSVSLKVQFGLKHKLAGFSVFAIDTDDFRGDCGKKYPLLHTVLKEVSIYRYDIDVDNDLSIGEIKNGSNYISGMSSLLVIVFVVKLCF